MSATAPSTRPDRTGSRPLLRRIAVTACYVITVIGSVIGVGVFGGEPIAEAAGGLLAADSTHLAPASTAFSIWSVIYAGLGAYTLWQWWDVDDHRGIAGHAIASLLLNAAWILVIQAGWVWVSVLVIVTLLVVLADLFRRLIATPPRGVIGRVVVDGTFGLYLGWVSVATCANIAAALAGSGFFGLGIPQWIASAVLAVAAAVGIGLCLAGNRPIGAPAAMIWGLTWIAVGRATDEPFSPVTAVAAGVAAALIAAAAIAQWVRPAPEPATR